MDNTTFQNYQSSLRALLDQALVEALKRNEAQTKTWTDYRKSHEKVIKGLEILPQELTTNCMVPIGKKALMKGKLVHTNEILVCLGEGYFAKYSAKQAMGVCDRRIKQANEMLINLEKERNLLEMRQSVPIDYGIFGDEEKQEIIETYVEEEEQQWRIKHRQREKEYRQKLAQLRAQEKTEIQSQEDLWNRLDELEMQEELEDEINRLQADDCNYYGEDIPEDEESYEEEDCDFSEDETTDDMIKERLTKLGNNTISKEQKDLLKTEVSHKEVDCKLSSIGNTSNVYASSSSSTLEITTVENKSRTEIGENKSECSLAPTLTQHELNKYLSSQTSKNFLSTSEGRSTDSADVKNTFSNSNSDVEKSSSSTIQEISVRNNNADINITKSDASKRRVSFTDKIQVNIFEKPGDHSFVQPERRESESSSESDIEDDPEKLQIMQDFMSVGGNVSLNDEHTEKSEDSEDETDDIIRINFTHSDTKPRISHKSPKDDTIDDPSDIYRVFCYPKSILKKSSSDVDYSKNVIPPADDNFNEEETDEVSCGTSYTIIVKDVEERKPEIPEVKTSSSNIRPLSRFKMARSAVKH